MKLNEIKLLEMPEDFLKDPDDIKDWLAKHNVKSVRDNGTYSLIRPNRDGTTDILFSAAYGTHTLSFSKNTLLLGKDHLPVQLGEVGKLDILLDELPIKNLKGMPKQMDGNLWLNNCQNIISFAGAPRELGSLKIGNCGQMSLLGINDHIKKLTAPANGYIRLSIRSTEITSGGLGLLLIDGFNDFSFSNIGERAERAMKIICEYQGKPDDVFECQTRLIEEDLEEFAQL